MLYAGTLAYNSDKSVTKGLILPSGATGIDKNKANEYLQKCLDAYSELQAMNVYSLYQKNSNLATNYAQIFQSEINNAEIIFCKNYDGKNKPNNYLVCC